MGEDGTKNILLLVVLAGIVVGLAVSVIIGITILGQMSEVTRVDTTVNRSTSSDVIAATNTSVRFGTSGQFPFLTDLTGCINATNTSLGLTKDTHYTIRRGSSTGGFFYLTQTGADLGSFNGVGINCSVVRYQANSAAQGAADLFILGLIIFGSFIGVIVVAVIGKILLEMFKPTGQG